MRKPVYSDTWPQLWKEAHAFNAMELWGDRKNLGYTYAYENRRTRIIDAVCELLPKGALILDVAAAHGNFTLPLAEKGYHVIWNDIRADMEGYVRLKYESGQVDYIAGNCFDLTEKYAEKFDAIIATEIIEHVAHPDQFLKGLAKLLKPGGFIMLSTPNGKWMMNTLPRFSDCTNPEIFESQQFKPDADGHIFLLHPDELEALATQASLRIHRFELINTLLVSGNRHVAKLLRVIPKWMIMRGDALLRLLPYFIRQKITSTAIVIYQKP